MRQMFKHLPRAHQRKLLVLAQRAPGFETRCEIKTFDEQGLGAPVGRNNADKGGERVFLERVPGTKRQKHVTIASAGHFLKEDEPDAIADLIASFICSTR